jgi:UPF0176 protein
MNTNFFKVAAFYAFAELKNIEELQMTFTKFLQKESIKGTVLLAQEGVNGTVAGTEAGIEEFKNFLQSQDLYVPQNFKTSSCIDDPFPRLKVKLKNEIVSIGNNLADPSKIVGKYVQPEDWNHLISQEDVLVLDTRNTYEVSIGTFKNLYNQKPQILENFLIGLRALNLLVLIKIKK